MERKELKAIVMAILSPRGSTMNLNEQNFNYMENNAEEILRRSGIEEKPKKTK